MVECSNNISKLGTICYKNTPAVIPPLSLKPVIAKCDSGASRHYFTEKDQHILINPTQLTTGPQVRLSNNNEVQTCSRGHVPLHTSLSQFATQANVFSQITSSSLISLGQLCVDGCTTMLDANKLYIIKQNKLLLTGHCNKQDDIWDIVIKPATAPPPTQAANAIVPVFTPPSH